MRKAPYPFLAQIASVAPASKPAVAQISRSASTAFSLLICIVFLLLSGCRSAQRDPKTVVFLIESSPTSLDPRVGTDGQSAHIDELLFDGLVQRNADFTFTPALAERWEQPDPLTVVFHLRQGVCFHNGKPLTASDVLYTINSMRSGKLVTAKGASYASVDKLEAPDAHTVVFHLKKPDNFLMVNLSTGAIGIVPEGSTSDFWKSPIGTGPFRFVSQQIDQNVLIERNPQSWSRVPSIERVRFAVVPDSITQSLELQKGSADVAVNSVPLDSLRELAKRSNVAIASTPGTPIQYLGFNLRDPILKDVRVRQAISCAIDRDSIIRTLQLGYAHPAISLLPVNHWAWTGNVERYDFNPSRATQLLDEAGFKPGPDGVRFHLTMKTSTLEETRLLAAVLQQQLASVGIALDLRSYEFATFYSDVVKGAFQLYSLRWLGGNEQPDIFSFAYSTARFSPKGANRSHYSNPRLDALLDEASQASDQALRRKNYVEAQRILAHDLPAINLWYRDTVVVSNHRLKKIVPSPSGSYLFLVQAEI